MYRATTPTHEFLLPIDTSNIKTVLISYAQGRKIILEKRTEEVTMSGNLCTVTLTQEETNLFEACDPCEPAFVQVRVLTTTGKSLASDKAWIHVEPVINDEVLT